MRKISALVKGKGRTKTIKLFLDGRFAFSLKEEVVLREGLETGMELSELRIASLQESNRYQKCLDTALRLLNYRPRSEQEINLRLQQRGYHESDIRAVLAKLKEVGLVDDGENAYRAAFKYVRNLNTADYPGFRRRLGEYLRRRGFGYDVINATVTRLWNEKEDGETANFPEAGSKSQRY